MHISTYTGPTRWAARGGSKENENKFQKSPENSRKNLDSS
jgi:hypothetical protein